nr:hydrogenase [candidate division Zixibacteria bacterium]
MVNIQDLRDNAKKLLKEETIKYIIGFKRGSNGLMPVPAFIDKPEDVDKLIWDPLCIHNLTRFLVDEKRRKDRQKEPDLRPVGLVVKGCDSRAVNVLLQEKLIDRADIHIIGVSCEDTGVVDEKKLAEKLKEKAIKKVEFGSKDEFVVTTDKGKVKIKAR